MYFKKIFNKAGYTKSVDFGIDLVNSESISVWGTEASHVKNKNNKYELL